MATITTTNAAVSVPIFNNSDNIQNYFNNSGNDNEVNDDDSMGLITQAGFDVLWDNWWLKHL